MLPSIFAISVPHRRDKARHNIACGLIDILACKHCRRATRAQYANPPSQRPGPSCSPGDLNNNNNTEEVRKNAEKKGPKMGLWKRLSSRNGREGVAGRDESMTRPLACNNRENKTTCRLSLDNRDVDNGNVLNPMSCLPRVSLSTSDLPNQVKFSSILKKDLDERWCEFNSDGSTLKKRARFSELVSVLVHDQEGKALGHDQIKLKESAPAPETVKSTTWEKSQAWIFKKAPFKLDSLQVIESDDSTEGYLTAVVFLGEGFASDKVELHSARMGLALAVIAYRLEPFGDGTQYYKRYSQRFSLPQPIDPYTIQAALITEGYIRIYASLLDSTE